MHNFSNPQVGVSFFVFVWLLFSIVDRCIGFDAHGWVLWIVLCSVISTMVLAGVLQPSALPSSAWLESAQVGPAFIQQPFSLALEKNFGAGDVIAWVADGHSVKISAS